MKALRSTDLLTGLLFLTLGGCVILYGLRYAMGSAMRMGPGYFPFLTSVCLMLVGLVLVVRSLIRGGKAIGTLALRPLFVVLLATLAFGLLIERAGFLLASIALVFASRLVDRGFRFGGGRGPGSLPHGVDRGDLPVWAGPAHPDDAVLTGRPWDSSSISSSVSRSRLRR